MTRSRRLAPATFGALLTASLLTGVVPAHAEATTMAHCTAAGGVWVVVQAPAEFNNGTPLDKQGCAITPTSGTDALQQIGIEITQADSMISQLDGVPTEVPATFDGNYWNYWTTTPVAGSETEVNPWTYAMTGPDESKPAAGSVEGWYYNNPGTEATVSALPTTLDQPATADTTSTTDSEDSETGSGVVGWVMGGVVVVAAAAGVVVARRSRGAQR